jgi:UDP-N-acetylmuramate: L-alanyl-gamma-D-glutamyl-meso-diaminopimelate ligase
MNEAKRFYLIGICGAAMAPLAGMLQKKGYQVSGSDSEIYPPMSDFLSGLGIPMYRGYSADHIRDAAPDIVVIGNALSRGNPEVEATLDSGVRYASMAETIKELFIRGKRSIVVAGTHGKTTTTALIAWILQTAERDPSFLVGGILENFGRSFQIGHGSDFVIEGDEYDTAFFDKGPKFLHYLPRIVVLNNIEFDHADIYANLEAVKTSFRRLINIVPKSGLIVAGTDSPVVSELIPAAFSRVEKVGLSAGDWNAANIAVEGDGMRFDAFHRGEPQGHYWIPLAGDFNVRNALGALAVAEELAIPHDVVARAFATFKSVKRRLEIKGRARGVTVYDDFAHHPTAVRETLRAVRQRYPENRVWAVFEPRSQTCRRRIFEQDFIESFDVADEIVIARVFAASRLPEAELLSPERVVEGLERRGKPARTFDSAAEIAAFIASKAQAGDHVVIMSNGGFDNIHRKLLDALG